MASTPATDTHNRNARWRKLFISGRPLWPFDLAPDYLVGFQFVVEILAAPNEYPSVDGERRCLGREAAIHKARVLAQQNGGLALGTRADHHHLRIQAENHAAEGE